MHRRHGFTIIELMVVISLIALLLSLTVVGLGQAMRRARILKCQTNLKSIGVAWQMYLEANKGYFPVYKQHVWWYYGGHDPCIFDFSGLGMNHRPLNPYLSLALQREGGAEVFACPDDQPIASKDEKGPGVTKGYTTFQFFGNSYILNPLLLYENDPRRPGPPYYQFNARAIRVPESWLVLTGDCQWYYSVNDAPWDAHFHNRNDKVNFVFMDGHVAYTQIVRGQSTTSDYTFSPQ